MMELTEEQIQYAQQTPEFLDTLEPHLQEVASQAYAMALDWIFIGVAICGCVGFIASLCLRAKKILGDNDAYNNSNNNNNGTDENSA